MASAGAVHGATPTTSDADGTSDATVEVGECQDLIPPPLFSTSAVADEEVPYGTAVELASISGMPFGQRGYGTSLTVGQVRTASAEGEGIDASSFAARTGAKRKRAGAATQGPKVNASLSTTAFPRLASSDLFVARLRSDLDALVDQCVDSWMHDGCSGSLMRIVEQQWRVNGWAYVHVAVGEDPATRRSFYNANARELVGRLSVHLSVNVDVASASPEDHHMREGVLRACIVLFLLYIFWATSPPALDETVLSVKEPEGLAPHRPVPGLNRPGSLTDCPAPPPDAFRQVIGRAWPIPIEVDILAELKSLPDRAQKWLDPAPGQGGSPPSEQVNAVLYTLTHHRSSGPVGSGSPLQCTAQTDPAGQAPGFEAISSSAWAILPPTSRGPCRVPPVVPDNWLCTQAEWDVQRGRWGSMRTGPGPEDRVPLTRDQRARAVVAQHLAQEGFFPSSPVALGGTGLGDGLGQMEVEPISTRGLKGRTARVSLRHPPSSSAVEDETELGPHASEQLSRVLDHRLPEAVQGVSSASTLARLARPHGGHGGADEGQVAKVVQILREIRSHPAAPEARARAQEIAAELGSPGLADLLASSEAEVAQSRSS